MGQKFSANLGTKENQLGTADIQKEIYSNLAAHFTDFSPHLYRLPATLKESQQPLATPGPNQGDAVLNQQAAG